MIGSTLVVIGFVQVLFASCRFDWPYADFAQLRYSKIGLLVDGDVVNAPLLTNYFYLSDYTNS